MKRKNNQITGNAGLFYLCYVLSKKGWNCLPTTRNAKGIDLLIYSVDAKMKYALQVKSLSKSSPVPFGTNPYLIADFLVVVRNVLDNNTEIFVLKRDEIKLTRCEKDGRVSYWLELKDYENYKERWDLIGEGW
ncbi:MAG: hypothetical protein ACPMAG_01730 [Limisphaerales bacterium]